MKKVIRLIFVNDANDGTLVIIIMLRTIYSSNTGS